MKKVVTVAILGAGNRGRASYAEFIKHKPEEAKVVAVADVDPEKVERVAQDHNIPSEKCFYSAEDILAQPKLADVMFICTQDKDHFAHAIPALEKGYDLVLEKPISPSAKECKIIAETARRLGRKIIVCHVLRYTPFYTKVKEIIDSGVLGKIINITAEEGVGYWHQCHSFVRGNWRNSDSSSPMIMAKCCHDMDILLWLTGKKCLKISSFGQLNEFKEENAPKGAALRCFDCDPETKAQCPYDAEKIYLDGPRGARNGFKGFPVRTICVDVNEENVTKVLKEGPYGRCVYHCDNNVVDTQIVNMQLEDGVTINFTMTAFSPKVCRKITVRGTRGELVGNMEAASIVVSPFDLTKKPIEYHTCSNFEILSNHSGGDEGMLKLIFRYFADGKESSSFTTIDRSVESHFVALAAEESRVQGGKVVDMNEWENRL